MFRLKKYNQMFECHFPELFEMKSEELKNDDNFPYLVDQYGDEERANEEWNWFFDQLVEINSGGYIYRLVFLRTLNDLDDGELGEHWTLTKENAKELEDTLRNQFFPEEGDIDDYDSYIIEVKTDPDNVDFESSMSQFCEYPWEQEINLKDDTKVKIISVEKL